MESHAHKASATKAAHGHEAAMNKDHYRRPGLMVLLSFVAMYVLMYGFPFS